MSEDKSFNILPHPHKGAQNTPSFPGSDAEQTSGLGGAPNLEHLHKAQADITGGKGPHIPDQSIAEGLEKPKTREELEALSKSLNE